MKWGNWLEKRLSIRSEKKMLKKEICFKCHMRNYGVDGTNCSNVKCYPPPIKTSKGTDKNEHM